MRAGAGRDHPAGLKHPFSLMRCPPRTPWMHFAQPRTPTPETSWNPRGGQPFKAWGGLRGYLGWVTTHGFRGRAGGDVTTTACPQSDQVRRSPPVKRHKLSAEPTATDHATPVSPRRPSIHITPPPSNRGTHLNAGCVAARRHGEGSGNCGRGGGGSREAYAWYMGQPGHIGEHIPDVPQGCGRRRSGCTS